MADFNNQWIEIFKAGNYGDKGDWSVERLKQVVANFNPKRWQPPLVLGHPEHDSPALGWIKELKVDDKLLLARCEKVHPALETLVADGRYPNRSAAFYLNPEGNGPMLRHVGFLGAIPPELKGLQAIEFSNLHWVGIELNKQLPSISQRMEIDPGSIALRDRALKIAAEIQKQDPKISKCAAFGEALRRARAQRRGG